MASNNTTENTYKMPTGTIQKAEEKPIEEKVQAANPSIGLDRVVKAPSSMWRYPSDPTNFETISGREFKEPSPRWRLKGKCSKEKVHDTNPSTMSDRVVKAPSAMWGDEDLATEADIPVNAPSDHDDTSTVRLRGGRGSRRRRDREEYNMGNHWSDDSDDWRGCCCAVM